MSNGDSSNSSVGIVAIIAILLLVGLGAWFMFGRTGGRSTAAPRQTSTPAAPGSDQPSVNVKVNLPDSINFKK